MRRIRWLSVGVFAATMSVAQPARADLARVRLAVMHTPGAEGCVSDSEVREEVRTRLGRDPFEAEALRAIEVVLSHDATAYTARIYTREDPSSPAASRVITTRPDDCPRLRASVALAVALAIDPDAPLAPLPPLRSNPPPSSPPPAPPPPPVAPPRNAPPDPQRWDRDDRLALGAGILVGPIPDVAPVLTLGVETARPRWLRGSFGAMRSFETLTDASFGTYGFALTAFWADLCAGIADGRWAGSVCLGVQAGFTSGVVHRFAGLVPDQPGDYGWLAAVAPIRGAVRIVDPLVFELSAEPYVALIRQRFEVRVNGTDQSVFDQSPVGLSLHARIRLRFW